MMTKTFYTLSSPDCITGEIKHRTFEDAIKARSKRDGIGWVIHNPEGRRVEEDSNGNEYVCDE